MRSEEGVAGLGAHSAGCGGLLVCQVTVPVLGGSGATEKRATKRVIPTRRPCSSPRCVRATFGLSASHRSAMRLFPSLLSGTAALTP